MILIYLGCIFGIFGMVKNFVGCVFLQEDLDVDDSEIGLEFEFQIVFIDLINLGEKRDKIFYVIILVYDFEEEDEEVYDSDNSVDLFQLIQV